MDNLAHTLVGIGIARAGLAQKYGRGTTLTLAIASNLPDLDSLWSMWSRFDYFTLRRTHSHALIAIPVLAALYVLVARRWLKHIPPGTLFGMAALGVAGHLLLDLVNAFGVVILWPFSRERFELASVFIIDLGVWAIALAPIVAARWLKGDPRVFRWALAALVAYLALCTAARYRAESLVATPGAVVRVFPEPLGPHRFRAVVKEGDVYTLSLVRVLSGRVEPRHRFVTHEQSPEVARCRCTPHGRTIDWFAAAPVWREEPDGSVEVYDLRFKSITIDRPNAFRWRFAPGETVPVPK